MKGKIAAILLSFAVVLSLGAIIPSPAQSSPEDDNFVAPIITHPDEIDKDFNGIEDALESKVTSSSLNDMEEPIAIIVILKQPYTEADLDAFLSAGGEIVHEYERVTYGFSGTLPLSKINELAEALGDKLNIIEQDRPTEAYLDVSTQIIRVRDTVWNTYGYRGDPNSAIAVIDTGIDDTHADLSGYQDAAGGWPAPNIKIVGWDDETAEATTSPVDYDGHGTCTASIACGTGASLGSGTITQLTTTYSGKLPFHFYEYLYREDRIVLPTTGTISLDMAWEGTGTAFVACFDPAETLMGVNTSSISPIIQNYSATAVGAYLTCFGNADSPGLMYQPFSALETYPYADVGDGENLFTGVAPETHLVGVRVSTVGDLLDGYDWLVANKNTYHIKAATSSVGSSSTDTDLRNAANSVVANGIVFTVIAGNDYPDTTICDPGLASKVITVGATNDEDGVTDYSSNGGDGSNKPDVVAPGGSLNVGSRITAADTNDCDAEVSTFGDRNANDYTNMSGTSMATPHVGGLAALVIQAMEDMGLTWTWSEADALRVKSIILMTACETNNAVHPGESTNDPPLNRGGNDLVEGYGRVNADAAIEAVTMDYTIGTTAQDTLGQNPTNKRVWARQVSLTGGDEYGLSLTVPAGTDFDLYLYDGTPGTDGIPIILEQSSAAATGGTETIDYTPLSSTNGYVVVKWVSGSGQFSLSSTGPEPNTPPLLSNGGVSPASGYVTTDFTYLVTYADADNDPPASPTVSIDGGGPIDMTEVDSGDTDYTDGKDYEYTTSGLDKGSHTFQFAASDGVADATGDTGSHGGPIVQNSAPNTPSNPSPANHAPTTAISANLSWTDGDPDAGDTVTYDIYFGTSATPPLFDDDQPGSTYNLGTLNYSTKYYWYVAATDNHGASTTGPIWDFTTEVQPNNPPNTPSNPSPGNQATGVSIDSNLGWSGGDPDAGDTVTYDVYFGTTLPPASQGTIGPYPATQSSITYDPGTLADDTKYYWLIVPTDNHGVTAGPFLAVWNFTTGKTGDVANLEGQVQLQGRPPSPHASWITDLAVTFLQGGGVVRTENVTTDNVGNFTIADVAAGTYDVCIKSPRALSELETGVVMISGTTSSVDFGTLREGDASDDDAISLADYALLYAAYGSASGDGNWNDSCDFNRNEAVDLGDYALLYSNYAQAGDCYAA